MNYIKHKTDFKKKHIFHGLKGHFEILDTFWLNYTKTIFKFFGGNIVEDLSSNNDDNKDVLEFKDRNLGNKKRFIIDYKWIIECRKQNKLLDFYSFK